MAVRAQSDEEMRQRDAGFTLPEIIAALAILALALAGIFDALSNGLQRTGQAEATAESVSLAQSLLARVGSEIALLPGTMTGEFPNGYRWRVQVATYGNAEDRRAWPVAAYTITAEVARGESMQRPLAQLTTLRLAPKGPAP
jgi:general secretion pathway protein I